MDKVEIDIDGKLISLEAGDLARQACGAAREGNSIGLLVSVGQNGFMEVRRLASRISIFTAPFARQ